MPTVHMVTAFVGPNQITEGFYTVEGRLLTMVRPDGSPVLLGEAPVTAKLQPDSKPDQVAKLLTKRIRKALRGDLVEGFDRPLVYPRMSIA